MVHSWLQWLCSKLVETWTGLLPPRYQESWKELVQESELIWWKRGNSHTERTGLTSEALTRSMALLFQASSWLILRCNSCWMLFAASSTRLQTHTTNQKCQSYKIIKNIKTLQTLPVCTTCQHIFIFDFRLSGTTSVIEEDSFISFYFYFGFNFTSSQFSFGISCSFCFVLFLYNNTGTFVKGKI